MSFYYKVVMQAQKTSSKSTKNIGDIKNRKDGVAVYVNRDLRSKLIDGLLTALLLLLLTIVVVFFVAPINRQFGYPGLLVYTLILLALSAYTLDRSLNTRLPETTRAWYGLIGGMLAWNVAVFSSRMALSDLLSDAYLLIFILLTLIVITLWHRVFPISVKFFSQALLLSWLCQYLQSKAVIMDQFLKSLTGSFNWVSYLAILGVMGTLFWLFFYSDRRIKRMWGALWIWFFLAMLVYVTHGGAI